MREIRPALEMLREWLSPPTFPVSGRIFNGAILRHQKEEQQTIRRLTAQLHSFLLPPTPVRVKKALPKTTTQIGNIRNSNTWLQTFLKRRAVAYG